VLRHDDHPQKVITGEPEYVSPMLMNSEKKVYTKKELRHLYNVSQSTFTRMLADVPELKTGMRKLIYPKELKLIIEMYGEPEW